MSENHSKESTSIKSVGTQVPEKLPRANFELPVKGPAVNRVSSEILDQLGTLNTATVCAVLSGLGIRQTFMYGPTPRFPGRRVVGTAITLQFMPMREDVASIEYYGETKSALWEVMETIEPQDVLVVQSANNAYTGVVGEMLTAYFKGRGGVGMYVDGYVRDWPGLKPIDVPIWSYGSTPHHASQGGLYPWGYNVPVNICNVLVLPGDIILADDDGGVVIPVQVAQTVIDRASHKEGWEEFSRERLLEGGELRDYYPLSDKKWDEYEAWLKENK